MGEVTQTLVHDVFILNMNNKKVEEILCIELFTNTVDALQYAILYEEGMKRQKSMSTCVVDQPKMVKSEPVLAVDKHNLRKCFRCGADNFYLEHLKKCSAKNHQCEFCSIMCH